MKTIRLLCLLLAGTTTVMAQVAPVIAPEKRVESLATVNHLLAPRDSAAPLNLKNPFHSDAFAAIVNPGERAEANRSEPAAGPRSSRDLMATIAEGLRPSGFFILGRDPTLVFGQKRVKAGDAMTITFDGREFTVVITTITPPNFTFRLGNEEFTRPIR